MRKSFLVLFVLALSVVALPLAPAGAEAPAKGDIDIPVSTVVSGSPGSTHTLATVAIEPSLRGHVCSVVAIAENNESVHPDSDLTVASGSSSVKILDVEASPDVTIPADGTLVLGADLVVSVTLGADGVFSGGILVSLTCEDPPPPTTTPPTTTTPPPTTTTPPPTTPTTPVIISAQSLPAPPIAVAVQPSAVVSQPRTTG